MIDKFHTLQDLKNTGLKMFGAHVSSDAAVGEYFLQPEVISMWDFKDYSEFYTYFDEGIKLVVKLCIKTDKNTTKCSFLKHEDLKKLYY